MRRRGPAVSPPPRRVRARREAILALSGLGAGRDRVCWDARAAPRVLFLHTGRKPRRRRARRARAPRGRVLSRACDAGA